MDDEEVMCHCCGFENIPLKEYDLNRHGKAMLCELCAGSFFSTALQYPGQVDNPTMWRSVAYGINMILREIRKQK